MLLMLLACPRGPEFVVVPEEEDTDEPLESPWTQGPDLPECTPSEGSGTLVALSGVVLLPDEAVAGMVVYDTATGRITCAGACDPGAARVVCTDGVIAPGLVDAHDHLQYNVLGPWDHEDLYQSRYEWQSDGDYWDNREAYDAVWDDGGYTCEIGQWAELRLLAGGATSAVGRSGPSCLDGLVRNLDEGEASHGFDGYELFYDSGKVEWLASEDGDDFRDDLQAGVYGAVLHHVAEGVGGTVRSELDHMSDVGATGPGFAYVHATDATVTELAQMAADGTAIVWSPRSNLDLYGATTLVDVADRLGVDVALAPDWTWSGSAHMGEELTCAYEYLASRGVAVDQTLVGWTTTDAARVVGLDGVLGALEPEYAADIAVFPWSSEPWRSVIEAGPEDVRLTIVGGEVLYGLPELVAGLAEGCQEVIACEQTRSFCVDVDVQQLETTLSAALANAPGGSGTDHDLYGLYRCEEPPSCDLRVVSDTDRDGDGIANEADPCPDAWEAEPLDHDGDGVGDACDPCPLAADRTTCAHERTDLDGDGTANETDLCPWLHDGQTDADGDDKGDACDDCPDFANPGDTPCPAKTLGIRDLRDPSSPDHPNPGDAVSVEGVVTAIRAERGFVLQDPDEDEYAGIFVFDEGANSVGLGDAVAVTGIYAEYFELSEIDDPTANVLGLAGVPDPIEVQPCDVATGGTSAERYESMLLTVQGVDVTDANPDGQDDYDEFEVAGCLRVDDWLCDDCVDDQPSEGTTYAEITGVLTYTFDNFKLAPRDEDDIVK